MDFNPISDENYARLISHSMTVPQHIKVTGETDNLPHNGMNGWDYTKETFDMTVPDRIVVGGQGEYIALPRELPNDHSASAPSNPGLIRVNTPPRSITLDQHYYPSAYDTPEANAGSPPTAAALPVPMSRRQPDFFNDSLFNDRSMMRDSTPPYGSGEGLSTSEEIVHLRRQMVRINRRVMAIEMEQVQRQQREKVIYAIGVAYLAFKIIAWLNRSQ